MERCSAVLKFHEDSSSLSKKTSMERDYVGRTSKSGVTLLPIFLTLDHNLMVINAPNSAQLLPDFSVPLYIAVSSLANSGHC